MKKLDDQPSQSQSKKRAASEGARNAPKEKKSKPASAHYAATLAEVEEVIKQLREKHGTLYSVEQLNCWAHMYQTQKHGSLDIPPNLPYFKAAKHSRSSARNDSQDSTIPSRASLSPPSCGISPSKRVTLRTECMKQLELWHSLLEKGGISKDQYDDLQQTILEDIKDNF